LSESPFGLEEENEEQANANGANAADEMGELVGKEAKKIGQKDFDPRGQYKSVIDAVKDEVDGELGFFQVELDRTRSEYVVVGVDAKKGRLVGLKALSVES
jgi:hypothetical protein